MGLFFFPCIAFNLPVRTALTVVHQFRDSCVLFSSGSRNLLEYFSPLTSSLTHWCSVLSCFISECLSFPKHSIIPLSRHCGLYCDPMETRFVSQHTLYLAGQNVPCALEKSAHSEGRVGSPDTSIRLFHSFLQG